MKKAHTHALWIYGVVVGLAIREALTQAMPFVVHQATTVPDVSRLTPDLQKAVLLLLRPFQPSLSQMVLMGFRVVLFLVMIVRFYFGAVVHFGKWHDPEPVAANEDATGTGAKGTEFQPKAVTHSNDSKKKSFGLDFIVGLAHFLIFFAWSYSITSFQRTSRSGISWFMVLLTVVLAYDFIWWFVSRRFDTAKHILVWAVLNVATLAGAFIFYVIAAYFASFDIAEEISFLPVLAMTVWDFGDMISGKHLLAIWLRNVFGATDKEEPPSAAAAGA